MRQGKDMYFNAFRKVQNFFKKTCKCQKNVVPLLSLFNHPKWIMDALSDTLYHALQGFETQQAMQYNRCIGLPCRQIVRIGVEVAQIMLGDELVEEHLHSYLSLIHRRLYDSRQTVMTLIVMAALFSLIRNDRQASRCRAALVEQWGDDIYDAYRSYRLAVDEQIDCEIAKQPSQSYTLSVMKTDQPQTIINVSGNYIAQQNVDIHDNTNCNIYACPQPEAQPSTAAPTPEPAHEPSPDDAFFCCITQEAIRTGKAQQVENELSGAAKSTAPKLIAALRTNEALGYVDTKNLSSAELYAMLNRHFGLKYSQRQFTRARNQM